ncbi:hypothetical protein A3K89_19030 [Rhodococcoides kyotonense]|uniref:Uncharacterized protein n=1 Tax=Rhodococcoides kyotonense TaxID=398843 RepID=A0A177YJF3_9NOCA|nr:hypothetical protein A3K89_19030 [Rhodococcus kyotonensis]
MVDWCSAAELVLLPAIPAALAEFLIDTPPGRTVQRRLVSAINRQHVDAGRVVLAERGRFGSLSTPPGQNGSLSAPNASTALLAGQLQHNRIPEMRKEPQTTWAGGGSD